MHVAKDRMTPKNTRLDANVVWTRLETPKDQTDENRDRYRRENTRL
jgi:hypothetical protein